MPLFTSRKQGKKVKVTFSNGLLFVEKEDGKSEAFPLEFFPKLLNATDEQSSTEVVNARFVVGADGQWPRPPNHVHDFGQ